MAYLDHAGELGDELAAARQDVADQERQVREGQGLHRAALGRAASEVREENCQPLARNAASAGSEVPADPAAS